jgi:hypothetical protein
LGLPALASLAAVRRQVTCTELARFVQRIADVGSVASGGFWSSEQLAHALMSDVIPAMVIGIVRDIKKRAQVSI